MKRTPCIVAMGGGGFSMEPGNPLLDDYILSLTGKREPRVCFVATASGDSREYIARFYGAFTPRACRPSHLTFFERTVQDLRAFILPQDVVYVGGGSTANMLAVWRLHGLDAVLRDAWQRGTVLCGLSAGSICWYEAGLTDSFGGLDPFRDGLGLLPGSHCPHYDGESKRQAVYEALIAKGALPDGIAADDGVGLRYAGTELAEAVSSRPGARAWRVERSELGSRRTELVPRYLGQREAGP